MIPVSDMQYHPEVEKLVKVLQDRTQREDALFFRVTVSYYMALMASQMRCYIDCPDNRGVLPVNMYALNLAPSGYGKNLASNFMEEEVLGLFRKRFMAETLPVLAEENLLTIATERAMREGADPEEVLEKVRNEYKHAGPFLFSFSSGTSPAVKAMRHKLLMAKAGSMNLIIDEIGANLLDNQEVLDTFVELFDKGLTKQKLVKNTTDNPRSEEILGQIPANLLMFGTPHNLLDGDKVESAAMNMLSMGYARRCFFGYVRSSAKARQLTAEELYEARTDKTNDIAVSNLALRMENLADIINANKHLTISKENCLELYRYELDCEARAQKVPSHRDTQARELAERSFKVLKLAGVYAFIDDSSEVKLDHIYNAIKLAEDSGKAFELMLNRDRPFVKLAKYIAEIGDDVTQADLAEDLPFYKGSASARQDLLTMAIAYGYKNNIVIKRSFADGVEFLRGESLKETNLDEMVVSYSTDLADNYRNEKVAFDRLDVLTQQPGFHWTNHHLRDGHRSEDHAISGFNLVVLDVDNGVTLDTAKLLMRDYKYLAYTTKRHTADENRFRMLLPTNYELKLGADEYREFMNSVFDWVPFPVDRQTNQRARKWLSNPGSYEFHDGELLDVLPFIPKTTKSEERKAVLLTQQGMNNLERWVINHTGDGNRNNMLLRYALLLVDTGADFESIRQSVMGLNGKLPDKLSETELMATVMVTVSKAIGKRGSP